MPRPRAVLFDLDGTLTDRPATVAAFAAAFVGHYAAALRFDPWAGASAVGPSPPPPPAARVASAIAAVDGNGHRPRARVFAHLLRVLPWVERPTAGELAAFWADAFPASTRPAAGLQQTLAELRGRGHRLGVVSNGGASSQRRKLDAVGVRPLMSAVVISGAVGVRKPDPRVFKLALDAVGTAAADAWFVGDHPEIDVLGARAAGLTPVWLRGAHPWPADHPAPTHVIGQLTDLLERVR